MREPALLSKVVFNRLPLFSHQRVGNLAANGFFQRKQATVDFELPETVSHRWVEAPAGRFHESEFET